MTQLNNTPGYFIDHIQTNAGEFHIPPNQMDDILPQHLLLLKSSKAALKDAGISPRPGANDPIRDRMGCAVGIEFDYGATDFRVRWDVHTLGESIKDQISGPLTFNRTWGL